MIVELLIFIVTFVAVYIWYARKSRLEFFRSKDVKFIPGHYILGNNSDSFYEKKHMVEEFIEIYNAFPGERYVGFFQGTKPVFIIRDPELIKLITVKNFDHFVNHIDFVPSEADVFVKSVLGMKDDTWRDMRATLSPAFTGAKMRQMVPSMVAVTKNVVEYLNEHSGEVLDVDELMRRYANDVIAAAGFGLEVNSFRDKDNEFYRIGQTLFKFTFRQKMVMLLFMLSPAITKFFKMTLFSEDVMRFFKEIVANTMKYREKNNIERPDMIQLLMEASKGTLKPVLTVDDPGVGFVTAQESPLSVGAQGELRNWTLEQLAGQVFIFFAAGFESSASGLVMAVHELALNPHAQDKLYAEVKAFNETKQLSYDNIAELKYLDCVFNETLRKWSSALFMDRVCSKGYDLPPPRKGANSVRVNPGDIVYNMVNAIHLDPQYYPNPNVFDPDRFSDENRHKISPFTFMPFGMGPRNCIATRFALLELKILLYHLVLNFKFLRCKKTMDPIRLLPGSFNIKAINGSHVICEKRN